MFTLASRSIDYSNKHVADEDYSPDIVCPLFSSNDAALTMDQGQRKQLQKHVKASDRR